MRRIALYRRALIQVRSASWNQRRSDTETQPSSGLVLKWKQCVHNEWVSIFQILFGTQVFQMCADASRCWSALLLRGSSRMLPLLHRLSSLFLRVFTLMKLRPLQAPSRVSVKLHLHPTHGAVKCIGTGQTTEVVLLVVVVVVVVEA